MLLLPGVAEGCRRAQAPVAFPPSTQTDARGAALAVLQAAQAGHTSPAELQPLVGTDLPREKRVSLRDALEVLRDTSAARPLGEDSPAGPDKTAVDLEVSLPGGGTATYTVQAARQPDGTWRVVSLHGPGVAWPPASVPKDEGLTTSAPPRPIAEEPR